MLSGLNRTQWHGESGQASVESSHVGEVRAQCQGLVAWQGRGSVGEAKGRSRGDAKGQSGEVEGCVARRRGSGDMCLV